MKLCADCASPIFDGGNCPNCGPTSAPSAAPTPAPRAGRSAPALSVAPAWQPQEARVREEPQFNTIVGVLLPIILFFAIGFSMPHMRIDDPDRMAFMAKFLWGLLLLPAGAMVKYMIDLYSE